jgi:hypothetical protein
VFDQAHLRRFLKTYSTYYNGIRTHLSLGKNAPDFRRLYKLHRSHFNSLSIGIVASIRWMSQSGANRSP